MQRIANILRSLFGRLTYTAPPWIAGINGFRRQRPAMFWTLSGLVLLSAIGIGYLMTLPSPLQVTAQITPPGPPADVEDPLPDPLVVRFDYDRENDRPDRPIPETAPSVARIDLIGKIVDGIGLNPALAGHWQWTDDRTLEFIPETAWPAGTRFTIDFPPSIFTPETRLKKAAAQFSTPSFQATIENLEFYQDPVQADQRKVVATILFSHPVDGSGLAPHITMAMRPSGEGMDTPPRPVDVTVTTDKTSRRAYLASAPLELPAQANTMRLTITPGIMPATGGTPTTESLSDTVLVPDRYSFLKVSEADTRIVTNDQGDPQQVISLAFTDAIAQKELMDKLSVHLLPEVNRRRNSRHWNSPRDVGDQELAAAQHLTVKAIPNPRDASTSYHFVIDAPEKRSLYLRIDPGLESANGFVQAGFFDTVLSVPAYPRQVRLAGEGSLVTAAGQQRLGIMARGLTALRTTVGRLLPGQLTHLITQTDGDIRDPDFTQAEFSEENITDISRTILTLKPLHPSRANYTALDLSTYLADGNRGYGLFFVSVEGWDPVNKRPVGGTADRRLILITDLGLVVKDNADNSHDVFVQRLSSGKPVEGAMVQLLGKNGLPLFRQATDTNGHAAMPTTRDFRNERQPSVYLVTTEADTAFIPFEGHARQVDYSRYDVGGEWDDAGRDGRLNAFLFSDRGIYRPGETVHLGMIVKTVPLDNVTDIPLEAVIQGPRHNTVKTERVTLPAKGFFEIAYPTDTTADTGRYQVSLYLVRDNRQRGRLLGSTAFTVEEFVPDTMKIKSTLMDVPPRGWTTAPSLTARVVLTNLFGTPAQDRRVQAHMRIRPAQFRFAEFADYHFSDPLDDASRSPLHLNEALAPATTDADGKVVFQIPLDRFREGTYQLSFSAEGFDPAGGRSVSAQNGTLISPLPHLVGFKTDGDLGFIHAGSDRQVAWIAIAPDLKRLTLSGLTLTRLEIQHLSTLVKQPNGTFAYQTVDRERVVDQSPFTIDASGSTTRLPTADSGDWAMEVHDLDGTRLARLTYTVVGHGNLTGRLEKEAALQVRLDKSDYQAGETIGLSITAPYVGAGLITIESDRVHAFKWFRTTTLSTLETIRLPDDLEGNAYLNVVFVRDTASREIFTSPLSTAVVPVTIDRIRRRLDVGLRVDEHVRPGQAMTIGYQCSQSARVAVFAVDEGILQVAGYRLPQPLDHFMKKRALRVTTRQMLDLILPEYELLREAMASGGGLMRKALAANLNPFARRTDKPAVFWSGIVDGGPEERTVDFTVPDTFSGNLVVMAVAVAENAVGSASTGTLVRGPFVLSPSLPLQAAPGDEFTATVGVSNLVQGSGPEAVVEVSVSASDGLTIVGERTLRLTVGQGSETPVHFTVRAGDAPGAASLAVTARLGDESARRTAGLSIRPAMPYRTTFASGYAENGTVQIPLSRRLFPQLAEQHAAASASPLVLVDALSAYLAHFPHGCTEQVVSQVFPLVGLSTLPAYASRRAEVEAHFGALIDRLRERQQANGGFSFWPGNATAADFPSVYAMHFLIDAREAGFAVPGDMLGRGTDYLRQVATRDTEELSDARVRAQAIYLLTRLGETTTNSLVRLQEQLEQTHKDRWRSDLTAMSMAATYTLLKMDDDAQRLVDGYPMGKGHDGPAGDFDRPLTRDAQALYLLSRHFAARAKALDGETLLRLVDPIFRGKTNTIGASYTILALAAYSRLNLPAGSTETIRFDLETAGGAKQPLEPRMNPFPVAVYTGDAGRMDISSPGSIFYLNVQSGFDRNLPDQPLRSGLEIHRDFVNTAGDVVDTFTQGEEVTVRLRIRSLEAGHVSNVAIIDLLPGGFEVVRRSVPRTVQGWRADYVDVREDRVVFYGSVEKSVRELTYRAKVTAPGRFARPPAFAEAMYDPNLQAATAAGTVTVAPAP
ncbi:alpha-2-macroglobulin [Desulfosarcina ovata]|uniref:Alpha-2-macroglobulin n=1 Tax=Desulfosarcina ovata subsp. ovata TaxID=2752305 RepID=A0A5K8ACA3_9BACT|nr:alpha-2-macroglobulin [Desulfosarcina ovata]BBO90353.1 alpha-2-macroglobulin [Desulfosarcina ovata subsp. ovata]